MGDRNDQLIRGKQVCNKVIQECKVKLPMVKMTYPEAIITNVQGFPDYNATIKQCQETLQHIKEQLK